MLFSSILFLFVFLPAALLLFFASPPRFRLAVLTLCSYVFYAWNDPHCLVLLWWVTIVDYTVGQLLGRGINGAAGYTVKPLSNRTRNVLLVLSLTNSLGLLFWFKYAAFAVEAANEFVSYGGFLGWSVPRMILPVGISFYTFESISYVVDIYRGVAHPAGAVKVDPSRPFLLRHLGGLNRFACYLAQFPHLVAGPIIRFQELEAQLLRPRQSLTRFAKGVMLFSFGMAKKVLLADTLAPIAQLVFNTSRVSTAHAWYGTIAFAFQIYFDFSGYTDMAMGLGMMLGFRFPRNFNSPYTAVSIVDFWRRWHMTLSRWLRDYVYISLGGNRRGNSRTFINLAITMLIAGVWHGAAWTYIVWGAYHGVWLAIERATRRRDPIAGWPRVVMTALTFAGVCVGWVIFRATTQHGAASLLTTMFVPGLHAADASPLANLFDAAGVAEMLIGCVISFSGVEAWTVSRRLTSVRALCAITLLLLSLTTLLFRASVPFLYFKF